MAGHAGDVTRSCRVLQPYACLQCSAEPGMTHAMAYALGQARAGAGAGAGAGDAWLAWAAGSIAA